MPKSQHSRKSRSSNTQRELRRTRGQYALPVTEDDPIPVAAMATHPVPSSQGDTLERLEKLLEGQAREILHLRSLQPGMPAAQGSAVAPADEQLPPVTTNTNRLCFSFSPTLENRLAAVSPIAHPPVNPLPSEALGQFSTGTDSIQSTSSLAPFLLLGATLSEGVKIKIRQRQFIDLPTLVSCSPKPPPVMVKWGEGLATSVNVAEKPLPQPQTCINRMA